MATDEIKEMLVDHNDDTTEKDWKRIAKKAYGDTIVRTFLNKKNNETVWVFGEADDEAIHPAGDHLYHIGHCDEDIMVCFNPVSYWKSDNCLWDQHCAWYITTIYNLPEWIELDEVSENTMVVTLGDGKTVADMEKVFIDAGLLFDQSFSSFMDEFC